MSTGQAEAATLLSLFIFATSRSVHTARWFFLTFHRRTKCCFLSWCVLALRQRLALELDDGMTYDYEMYVASEVYTQAKLRLCSTRISYNLTAGTTLKGLAVAHSSRPQFTRMDWVVTQWQTDSMAQAVGWTAESRIARQEMTCILVTWRLTSVFLTKLTSDSILRQINPV